MVFLTPLYRKKKTLSVNIAKYHMHYQAMDLTK